jgi:glucose-6-phosphate isomerase, archaeal
MKNKPYTFNLSAMTGLPNRWDHHYERRLSSMTGQFEDTTALDDILAEDNLLLYEVYEFKRPETAGELLHGVSVIHPGLVGNEFFMTKGHFHSLLETAEVYYCLKGKGVMVMETPEGEWDVQSFSPGSVLYVPPRWAHRSVNTSMDEDLVLLFVYPGDAGHDYGTIEFQGFRKLVLNVDGDVKIVDNPRWVAPEKRGG